MTAEASPRLVLPDRIAERPLTQPVGSQVLAASLGSGERETISLALEIEADRVILDDRAARRLAQDLGLPIIGTLGVLLAAKRRTILSNIRPQRDALIHHGFRIAPALYEQVLSDAGEWP
ncbi:MAG: DUF3368 domain-containing protein [Planctomycetaceae bacterium]